MIATALRKHLVFAPYKLSDTKRLFGSFDNLFLLVRIAREFVPEECAALIGMGLYDAHRHFRSAFEKKYFPLMGLNVEASLRGIPADLLGIQEQDYERYWRNSQLGWDTGWLLASVIVTNPYPESAGISREPVIDSFYREGKCGPELLDLLPAGGITIEQAEDILKGSPWPELLTVCRWVHRATGNFWLDNHCSFAAPLLWTQENVARLTADYASHLEMVKDMRRFDKSLGWNKHFPQMATEIITYISGRLPQKVRVCNG